MKKSLIIRVINYFLLILLTSTAYADDTRKIVRSEAKKLIQGHIGQFYVRVETGSYNRCLNDDSFPAARDFYLTLQEAGLLTVKIPNELSSEFGGFNQYFAQVNCGFGSHPVPIEADLTEKGKRASIPSGNDLSRVGFLMGKRTVSKIVSVTNADTVFFSYVYEPNDLGKALGDSKTKYRGKAIIKYDPFLEIYKFKGLFWSPWEHENWSDNTTWTYEQEGRIVVAKGIGADRAKSPQPSSNEKKSVKTAPMPSSQKPSYTSQQTKRRVVPKFERTYAAPFEDTWSSVLKVFEIFGDAIAEADKNSGVIKTKPSRRDVNWLMKYWVEYYIDVKDLNNGSTTVELEAEILYRKKDGALKTGNLKASKKEMKTSADEFFSELEKQQSSKQVGSGYTRKTTALSNQADPKAKGSFEVLTDKNSIAIIQQKLAELGYNPGPADGVSGEKTRVAISSYQRDQGLTADGLPTQKLLDVLTRAPESQAVEEVSPVKKSLNTLGSIFKNIVESAKTGGAESPASGGESGTP